MARKKKEVQVEDPFNYGGLISFLCVFILIFFSISKTGPVGLFINNLFSYLFGSYYLTLLITLFICAFIKVFLSHKYKFNVWFYIGITILNIAVMLLGTVLFYGKQESFPISIVVTALSYVKQLTLENVVFGGGLIGTLLMYLLMSAFEYTGTIVVLVLLFVIAAILIVPLGVFKVALRSVKDSGARVKERMSAFSEAKQQAKEEKYRQKQEQQDRENFDRMRKEAEEARLRNDIHNIFSDESFTYNQLQIPIEDKQTIEVVKNTSEFSKNFFIDDDQTNVTLSNNPDIVPVKDEQLQLKAALEKQKDETLQVTEETKSIKRSGKYHLPPESLLSKNTSNKASSNERARLFMVIPPFNILERL